MKATFDSNVWEQIVHPHVFIKDIKKNNELKIISDAIRNKILNGYICQSVITLEGIKKKDRPDFMTNQEMRPKPIKYAHSDDYAVILAPNQSSRPPLMPILLDRLKDATNLGIKIVEIPVYNEFSLPDYLLLRMTDEFIQRFGQVDHAIQQRGVGRDVLTKLGRQLAMRAGGVHVYFVGALPKVDNLSSEEKILIVKAVAEAADGDAMSAHVSMECDYFVTEDYGKSAGSPSILDKQNRKWLSDEYSVKFASLSEFAEIVSP